MQRCCRSMSLVRAESVRRLLHRKSACVYHQLGLQHLSRSSRQCQRSWRSTLCLLESPSLLNIDFTKKYSVVLDEVRFEQVSDETLESLSEYLDELVASETAPQDADVLYSTGVVTLQLGTFGTYVINKQTPNKQIWLSSPISGPKRFDFLDGVWVYRHTGETLHGLLNTELARVFSPDVDFFICAFGSSESA